MRMIMLFRYCHGEFRSPPAKLPLTLIGAAENPAEITVNIAIFTLIFRLGPLYSTPMPVCERIFEYILYGIQRH